MTVEYEDEESEKKKCEEHINLKKNQHRIVAQHYL